MREAMHVPPAQLTVDEVLSSQVTVAVWVSAAPASEYVVVIDAESPSETGAVGPEIEVITGATFVAVTVSRSPPVALPESVTVTLTSYAPSSSGVKLIELPLPVAYGELLFVTVHAYVKVLSSTSVTLTVAVTALPSFVEDGTVIDADGASFTELTVTFTVAVAQSDGVPLSQTV